MTGCIVYHCTAAHAYTIDGWFDLISIAEGMPQVTLQTYDRISDSAPPEPGTHVFTDQDRLDRTGMAAAVALARRVAAAGRGYAVANWPNRVLGRYELLRLLHASGRNSFRCYRLDEHPVGLRYPVFLRLDPGHLGAATSLLHDARELNTAVAVQLVENGRRREDILIVEFVETDRIDGNFAKYAAYCAFGEVHPASMVITAEWIAKALRLGTEQAYAIEIDYAQRNPHAAEVAEVFRVAHIDYGRIDYGLEKGQLQVFEINTNPDLLAPSAWNDAVRRERFLLPWQAPATRAIFRRLAAASAESARRDDMPADGLGLPRGFLRMVQHCREQAESGEPADQFKLGTMYTSGQWVPQDYVQAHKWFELAAASFGASRSSDRQRAATAQEQVAARMSPQQLAEARLLARNWKPRR